MLVVGREIVENAARNHADARPALENWIVVTGAAVWKRFIDVRQSFSSADAVTLKSGAVIVIFNIRGNYYRLLTTIDYVNHVVTVQMFLTHREYGRDKWKRTL